MRRTDTPKIGARRRVAASVSGSEISTPGAVFSGVDIYRVNENAPRPIVKTPSGEITVEDTLESTIWQNHLRIGEKKSRIVLDEERSCCRKSFRNIGIVKEDAFRPSEWKHAGDDLHIRFCRISLQRIDIIKIWRIGTLENAVYTILEIVLLKAVQFVC